MQAWQNKLLSVALKYTNGSLSTANAYLFCKLGGMSGTMWKVLAVPALGHTEQGDLCVTAEEIASTRILLYKC